MSNHVMLPGYILARQVYELSYLNGIQEKITETNKVSADFIENGDTNKVVTSTDIVNWNAKVSPSELSAQSYVTSAQLDQASYISSFEESDPTVPAYVKSITENDIANWNAAQGVSLIETTYSELVSLTNDGELKPGTMYRITDYATTTSYANTSSAGKLFDLVVTAISENELSEDAKAINHEGENFTDPFASSNVVSWDIKYSINNDATRFTWADAANGKGVIYWMRDEHGNECNYDFKNIMFSFPSATASFVDTSKQYYTFSNVDNGTVSDATVGSSSPSLNKINVGQKFLPFLAIICSSGSIGDFNTIGYADNVLVNGNGFSENKIGRVENCVFDHGTITNVINEIYNTTIGNSCVNNVIKYMSGCSIGVSCAYNNIGRVTNITAVDGFMMNTIGDSVSDLNVGTYFYGNEIGNYCTDFIAGYMCYGNVFQTMVQHVTMGDYCYINKFFANVNNIRMGNYCFSNIFENGYYIYFGNTSNQGADWICYNRFLGATQYIYFYNTGTANSDNQLRKYHLYNICGYSNQYKEVTGLTRQNASELFILTRPGYATPAANSLIFVDPAMIPEKMKGGLTGQFLKKNSNTDYDVSWADMTIPTKLSDLTNDVSYITQADLSANAYLTEHQSLSAYPTKAELSAQSYLKAIPSEYITQADLSANGYLTSHQDLTTYAKKTDAIGSLSLSLDSTNYKVTLSGTKVDGTAFTVDNVIDLPLESVVVSGYYDSTNKKVALTLENGSVVDFSVADLVNGLQSEITTNNKLSSDLIDDTNKTHKFVTSADIDSWNERVTKAELSAQSYLQSIPSEYITQAELSANAYLTEHQSLDAYPTKAELSAQGYLKSIPAEYITQAELSANAYLTEHQSLAAYPTKSELSAQGYLKSIPPEYITQAELSANTYLTEHQSLDAYPTKADLSAQGYLKSELDPTVPTYVKNITEANISSWNSKLDSFTELDPTVPTYVKNITEANISSWNSKLDSFTEQDPVFAASAAHGITSSDINSWNDKVSKAELSAQGYITSIPSEYITQAELSANTYLTEHQSLAAYPTKAELSAQGYITSIPDEYITQAELSANAYLTEHQSLAAYPTKAELSAQGYLKSIPDEYITQAELSANAYLTEHQSLAAYPTKAELSAQGYLKSIPPEYITQAELSANAYLTEHQSLAAYPTKAELSAQAYLKAVPAEYVTQAELSANGYLTAHQDLTTYAKKSDAIGSLSLSLNSSDYKITLSGTKVDGTSFTVSNVIDLPLESVVVSGYYDSTNKKVALTLENGSVVDFSVADLVNGLQTEITSSNKLSADLVQDGSTNKVVTATEKADWNSRVTKAELSAQAYLKAVPSEYVTQAELSANAYLTEHQSLAAYPTKAELSAQAYIKSETDPTVPTYVKNITEADISSWNNKTSNVGTITGINMNGSSKGTSGVVDLGTVITSETQSDWNVTDDNSAAFIKNKPTIPNGMELLILDEDTGTLTKAQIDLAQSNHCIIVYDNEFYYKNYVEGVAFEYILNYIDYANNGIRQKVISLNANDYSYEVQDHVLDIQSDWNESDSTNVAYIKNKPVIPAEVTESTVSGWGFTKNTGTLTSESDPVFTTSAAHGITSTDISNWNAKVSKSDLSAQAYLTSHAKHKLTIATGTTTANSGNSITFIESLTGTTTATDGDLTLTPTKKTITIPSAANNSTITIQKGGTTVDSFTTNASSNKTINIPNELPSYSSSDSGKVLSVNSSGQLVWITPVSIYTGSGTPSNSLGNNGDIYLQS